MTSLRILSNLPPNPYFRTMGESARTEMCGKVKENPGGGEIRTFLKQQQKEAQNQLCWQAVAHEG